MVGALPTEMRRLRELVDGMLADWGVSIRRACKVRPPDTSSNPYKSRRTDPPAIKKRIKAICATHVRFGYRRGHARSDLPQGGYPKTIRVDNGSEFVSRDMDLWACRRGVTLDFSRLGKPTGNAFIEAFNSKLRRECVNTHWFLSRDDVCEKLDRWRR